MRLKASTSDGSPSSDGLKSYTGGFSPGIGTFWSGKLPGSTILDAFSLSTSQGLTSWFSMVLHPEAATEHQDQTTASARFPLSAFPAFDLQQAIVLGQAF